MLRDLSKWLVMGTMAFLCLQLAGLLVLHWGARRAIRRTIEGTGSTVKRIRRFNGFLDLGSIAKAATSAPYSVTVAARDGKESDLLCLARYIPIVGFVWSVEVQWEKWKKWEKTVS